MMNFEEFLKEEERLIKSYEKAPSWHGRFAEYKGFRKRLGNWAWDEYVKKVYPNEKKFFAIAKVFSESKEEAKEVKNFLRENSEHYKIAIACLDKEEIRKRLGEMR